MQENFFAGEVMKIKGQVDYDYTYFLGFPLSQGKYIENPKKKTYFSENYFKVHDVSCGSAHIAVVALKKHESADEAGYVFTWGLPLYGRLGYIDYSNEGKKNEDEYKYVCEPQQIFIPEKVTRVYSGNDFSACITIRGQVYVWGTNKWGNLGVELGFNEKDYIVPTPTIIKALIKKYIIQVLSFLIIFSLRVAQNICQL